MPLIKSGSKKAVSANIKEMRAAGYPEDRAVAAAERVKDQAKKRIKPR